MFLIIGNPATTYTKKTASWRFPWYRFCVVIIGFALDYKANIGKFSNPSKSFPIISCRQYLRYTPYTPTTSRYTSICKGVRGVIGSDSAKGVGATKKKFLLCLASRTLFTQKRSDLQMQATPLDNKNNMSDILNSYFLDTLLAFCIGHYIEW